MDTPTLIIEIGKLIVELVKALIWPIIVIVVIVIFKRPLTDLLSTIERLIWRRKGNELIIDFDRETSQVESEIKQQIPEADIEPYKEKSHKDFDRVYYVLERSPRSALFNAWTILELKAVEVLAKHGYFQGKTDPRVDIYAIMEALKKKKLMDREHLMLFDRLRRLSNTATHSRVIRISGSIAKDYIESARRLYVYFSKLIDEGQNG